MPGWIVLISKRMLVKEERRRTCVVEVSKPLWGCGTNATTSMLVPLTQKRRSLNNYFFQYTTATQRKNIAKNEKLKDDRQSALQSWLNSYCCPLRRLTWVSNYATYKKASGILRFTHYELIVANGCAMQLFRLCLRQAQKMWVENTGKTFTFCVGNFFSRRWSLEPT